MKGYPKWFTVGLIASLMTGLFLSGSLLIPSMLDQRLQIDTNWRLPEGGRALVAAIHVMISFLVLALIGALWSVHMRVEWRKGEKRKSGFSLVTTTAFLALSGIGIFYFGSQALSLASSLSHVLVGNILFLAFIFHISILRKKVN